MERLILVALMLGALALAAGGLILRYGAQGPAPDPARPRQTMGPRVAPGKTVGTSALSHGGGGSAERNRDTGTAQPPSGKR